MDFLVQVVALCCVLTVSYSATIKTPTIEELCTSCTEKGCLAPWSSCEEYVECKVGGESLLRRCPHGLHFSRDLRGCDWPKEANCTNDLCKKDLTLEVHAVTDHCRRYWECVGDGTARYSSGLCCKDNKTFDVTTKRCSDMSPSNCNDTCNENDNSTKCTLYKNKNDIHTFFNGAPDGIKQSCNGNMVFDETECQCMDPPATFEAATTPACNLDITLTFNSNGFKYKGAWPDVRQVSKGESFGENDTVLIPFYNRNGLNRFAGRIVFRRQSSPTVQKPINETLISKCAENKDNFFMVKLDTSEEHIHFQLSGSTILKIMYKAGIWNVLEFSLENGIIDAKVMVNDTVSGNLETISNGKGSLSSIQKEGAVKIGQTTCNYAYYPGFTGKIKEIKFAKCDFLMKKSSPP